MTELLDARGVPIMSLVDARGVEISPGDVALYGFGVGQSIAMAEGVVVGNEDHYEMAMMRDGFGVGPAECSCGASHPCPLSVSLTPSGRVRVRVVRRSYGGGSKPVVDIAPDRLVVLKASPYPELMAAYLPPSPQPTQAEANRQQIENAIISYTRGLRRTETPDFWDGDLVSYHAWCADRLADCRKKLRALDD